jgi:hypothetical protein
VIDSSFWTHVGISILGLFSGRISSVSLAFEYSVSCCRQHFHLGLPHISQEQQQHQGYFNSLYHTKGISSLLESFYKNDVRLKLLVPSLQS